MADSPRFLTDLTAAESLRLLGSISLGRIVFTAHALPAIRPVNHIVDDGTVIIRSHQGAAIVSAAHAPDGVVVAYEADAIDLADHLGWSVIVIGLAQQVTDPAEIARYQALLRSWVAGPMDYVIRIRPELVTGFRLTGGADSDASASGRDSPCAAGYPQGRRT